MSVRTLVPGSIIALVLALGTACSSGPAVEEGPQIDGGPVAVAGAHEHGVARLAITLEGSEAFVTLEAPSMTLFGFERDARTDEERDLIATRTAALEAGLASAILFPTGVTCTAGATTVSGGPMVDAAAGEDTHSHDHPDEETAHDEDEHAHGEDDHEHGEDDHAHAEGEQEQTEDEHTEDEHAHAEDEHDHEHDEEGSVHSEVMAEVTLSCNASLVGAEATLALAALLPGLEEVDLTVLTEFGDAAGRVAGDASFVF